ncbi:MAG: ferritin-like fold-containing protein [Brevundimonas sp.]
MTTTRRDGAPQPVGDRPAGERPTGDTADTVELLGLVAHLEHTAFVRLASDSAIAPTVEQRLALSRFAAAAVQRRDRVLARIVELGGDPEAALRQFDDVLTDFDARTQPSTWWERLLKAYVGYGVADDFCRLVAEGLDERSREIVLEVLDDASHADLAVTELDAAGSDDGVLTSRLALWGRRLVGEALGVVQGLLTQRPGLTRLLARSDARAAEAEGKPTPTAPANGPGKVFGELTAQHTRRMSRLGLTP